LRLLAALVGLVLRLVLIGAVLSLDQAYFASAIGQRVMHDLREILYQHLQRMSLRFCTSRKTGEIQSRLAQDVGGVGEVLSGSAVSVAANAVFVATPLVAMALPCWQPPA